MIWFCDLCDKTINNKSKSKQINSKSDKHNENYKVIVTEYEFEKLLIQKKGSIIDNCIRDCHNKCFHKCIFKINFTIIRNNERVNLADADKQMNLYGLNINLKSVRRNGIIFNGKNILTLKNFSNLSNINICF